MMTLPQQIFTVAVVALGTMATRFIPFMLFPPTKKTPSYVKYLGAVLPSAVFGMLIIYCLKDVELTTGNHGIPEGIAILVTVLLHLKKRQMLLSIGGGTVVYMLMVQYLY